MSSGMRWIGLGLAGSVTIVVVGLVVALGRPPAPAAQVNPGLRPAFSHVSSDISDFDDFQRVEDQFEAQLAMHGMSREQRFGVPAEAEPPVETRVRVPGAYYPDEVQTVEPAEGSVLPAVVAAAAGGGLVAALFGGAFLVLFRRSAGAEEEAVEPEVSVAETPERAAAPVASDVTTT